MKTQSFTRPDASLGIQNASIWQLRKTNELEDGRNIRFNEEIGSYQRRLGYIKEGSAFSASGKIPIDGITANFTTGAKRFVAVPAEDNSAILVRSQNSDGTWTTIINDIPFGSDVYFTPYRDEIYVTGFVIATDAPWQPYNIDKTLTVSRTHNLLYAPYPKFLVTYKGLLYAANVSANGSRYPDRLYKASAPTGAITFLQGDQSDVLAPVTLINNVPVMTSNTTPSGTAFASSQQGVGAGPYLAFDRQTTLAYKWLSATTTGYVGYDFGAGNAKAITYYGLTAVPDEPAQTGRAPKTWTFEGSNDNTTWVVLDTQTNAAVWAPQETRTYTITNTTSYRYYRLNVSANEGATDYLAVAELYLYTSSQGTKSLQAQLDSVRYIKPTMNLDVYKAGTQTKLYDIQVLTVDKVANTITFNPLIQSFLPAAVTISTDTITVPSTTGFTTGSSIKFDSTGTVPAPLVADTIYYAIVVDATNIKVATTYGNAIMGFPIDLTSQGTGSHRLRMSYNFSNNDEIWLDGTIGKLTTFWNTDYPTIDIADWTAVQSGLDSSNAISAARESNGRLFVFTNNSASKFDGTSTVPFNSTVGCVGQRTLRNIDDDWLIWVSSRGRVYARNEATGSQQYISRGIANKLLSQIPYTQLKSSATAGISDGEYILYVGTFKGEPTRAVYDFGTNTWSIDALHHPSLIYINDVSATGFIQPYFFSNNGFLYQDNIGNKDDTQPIRFEARYGKVNYGSENVKDFLGCFVYSENAQGLKVIARIDNDPDPIVVGQISESLGTAITYLVNGRPKQLTGTAIDISIVGAIDGPPQSIQQIIDYYNYVDTMAGYGPTT